MDTPSHLPLQSAIFLCFRFHGLHYLLGEIMYGGHIIDGWDRRLCRTYLEVFMSPEQVRDCKFKILFQVSLQFNE